MCRIGSNSVLYKCKQTKGEQGTIFRASGTKFDGNVVLFGGSRGATPWIRWSLGIEQFGNARRKHRFHISSPLQREIFAPAWQKSCTWRKSRGFSRNESVSVGNYFDVTFVTSRGLPSREPGTWGLFFEYFPEVGNS